MTDQEKNQEKKQEWILLVEGLIQYLPQQEAFEKLLEFLIRSTNSLTGGVALRSRRERNWEILPASFAPHSEFQKILERFSNEDSSPAPYRKDNPAQLYFPLFDSRKKTEGVLYLARGSQSPAFGSFEEDMIRQTIPLFQKLLDQKTPGEQKENGQKKLHLGRFIGDSDAMKQVYRSIEKVVDSETTVAILGESGTGKELVAQALHEHSKRAEKAFIDVNCAAIPKELMESEFFGHEKGAFSGATGIKKGKFEMAQGGTLFLDEIGELSLDLQSKLLRVLQERKIWRVGGDRPIPINVRVVTATHQNIKTMVQQGKFRADLFYRLHVFPIHLPSLQKRQEDILLLAHHFLQEFAPHLRGFQPPALDLLQNYSWPGNIRELRHAIERAALHHEKGPLLSADFLLSSPQAQSNKLAGRIPRNEGKKEKQTLDETIRESLYQALSRNRFNKSQAAEELGIFRSRLARLMSKYSLQSA